MSSRRDPEQRRKRATIKEVAALAEVSTTTVSHAVNGKGRVDPATRARVLAAADRLGYRPSRAARALRTQRTGTIAFLVPTFERPPPLETRLLSLDVYMTQATAAARTAFAGDHALLLVHPSATVPDLHSLGVDGGIVCDPFPNDPLVGLFEALDLPVVTIERDPGRPDSEWYVCADNRATTRQLLDHLAAAGAQRIAILSVDFPIAWSQECREAYEAWSAEHGREPIVTPTDPHETERDAYAMAAALLDAPDPPDAILASDERFPSGVLRAADERGVRIPEDLLVATGIDSHAARQSTPAITAIDVDAAGQGGAAAELLIARLEGTEIEAPRIVPAKLHVRGSTKRS
jgi:DNA-binding LacI/PurR family transcriptional regulator